MEEGRPNEEKWVISFGCRCGYRLMWRFAGRGNISDVSEGNAIIMVGKNKE